MSPIAAATPAYANSLAFQRAGISEQTPDPQGGRFDRDPDPDG